MTMLKLNVGFSRKIGEARYGSRGAAVHLELEVESALVADPEQLQKRIRRLFHLTRAAVEEELAGQGHAATTSGLNGRATPSHDQDAPGHGNDSAPATPRYATFGQIRAVHAIAERHGIELAPELNDRFGVARVEELSVRQASELIDALRSAVNGHGVAR